MGVPPEFCSFLESPTAFRPFPVEYLPRAPLIRAATQMCPPSSSEHLSELERVVLRTLCAEAVPSAASEAAKRELKNYPWHDPEHRVVFEALQEARGSSLISLREQLPTHATRLGFPDVDWQNYFDRGGSGRKSEDIGKLVRDLKSASAERS